MEKIFEINKRGITVILTLCILIGIAGTCLNITAMAAETTAATEEITTIATEETTIATEDTTQELVPMMASWCCDYETVDDCMSDISSIYDFDYSPDGRGYSCSGDYSVVINNSHNYLNVILNYLGKCIDVFTCRRR